MPKQKKIIEDTVFRSILRKNELLAKKVRELLRIVSTDELTGLTNRRGFNEGLRTALLEVKRGGICTVGILDVDHFKRINDTWGHGVGDRVLKRISRVLREMLGSTSCVARIGGEEIGIIMPNTNQKQAHTLLDRVRRTIQETFSKRSSRFPRALRVTASFGIAQIQRRETGGSVLNRADQALYFSKENGRNRVSSAPISKTLKKKRSGERRRNRVNQPQNSRRKKRRLFFI